MRHLPLFILLASFSFITVTADQGESRIIGGENVELSDYPYIVSIQMKNFTEGNLGQHICAGAIYKENYIITSATCAYGEAAVNLTVVANLPKLAPEDTSTVQIVQVDEIIIHENYNIWNLTNNIALLKLANSIDTTLSSVGTVDIATSEPVENTECDVSGWGSLNEWGDFPNQLQAVTILVEAWEDCKALYGSEVDETMFCAGNDGKGPCLGDSGGPLTCGDSPVLLTGIVAWSYGCGQPGQPGVYTDVYSFTDWIVANTIPSP